MRIQHNITAMNSYRNYSGNTSAVGKNLEKLSSGYRINRAGDDAAGLAISQKMRIQITGLEQAQSNAKSGINLVQTAEGALTEVHDMLNRMYTLAEQSANGTYDSSTDRVQLQKEVDSLRTEIDRIADATNYNGINLLNGKMGQRAATQDTVVAGGVKMITATGGGTGTPKTAAVFTANVSTGGTVTLTAPAISGLKWVVTDSSGVKPATAASDSATGAVAGDYGGTVTFRAEFTSSNDVLDADRAYYEGMEISVTVDSQLMGSDGKLTGEYKAGDVTLSSLKGATGLTLQIGDTGDEYNQMDVNIKDMHATAMNISSVDISSVTGANDAMAQIKAATNYVSDMRGTLGALQNRLDHTINNLSVTQENIQDAESTIRDVDVAKEMMAYTKNSILVQSAQAMLAQANQLPQGVLQLLQ